MLETPARPILLAASEVVAAHLGELRDSGMPQAILDVHSGALRRFAEFLAPRALVEATPADTRAFVGYLGQVGVTEKSLRGYNQVLERWTSFLAARGLSAELLPALLTAAPVAASAAAPVAASAAVPTVASLPPAGPAAALMADELERTPRLVAEEALSEPQRQSVPALPPPPRPAGQSGFAPAEEVDHIALRDATPRDGASVPPVGAELSAFWGAPGKGAAGAGPDAATAGTTAGPAPGASRKPAFIVAPLPPEPEEAPAPRTGFGATGAPPPPPMSRARAAQAEVDALAGPSIGFAAPQSFGQGSNGGRIATPRAASGNARQAAPGGNAIGLAAAPEDNSVTALGDSIRPQEGARRGGEGLALTSAQWGLRQKRSSRSDLDLMEIRAMAKDGRLGPDDMVRKPGGQWTRAAEHPLLRQLLIAATTGSHRSAGGRPRGHGHDVDAGPCLGLATLGALVGGVAGGVAWWVLAALAGHEVGWAALGCGVLAAVGARTFAPSSTVRNVVGGVVVATSVLGLGIGKVLTYWAILSGVGTIKAGAASSLAGFIAGSLTPVSVVCALLGAALGFALAARPR